MSTTKRKMFPCPEKIRDRGSRLKRPPNATHFDNFTAGRLSLPIPMGGKSSNTLRKVAANSNSFNTIQSYNSGQSREDEQICTTLRLLIDRVLSEAESKIWHAHPVWFLDENPIVGYDKLNDCIRLMFWSGQTFEVEGLTSTGSFKAAEVRYTAAAQIDKKALETWLKESRRVQWDYKNIYKRRGRLQRLV